jgi:hypothetical protein
MARHGYLRGYDEEFERGGDRERGWSELSGNWRDRDRERGLLFGDQNRGERGMSHYGREHGYGGFQGDYSGGSEQGGFGGYGDYREGRRSFSANPDEHYRIWRDKQMRALDRDYEDYCGEREQQFHQDFDSWRRNPQSDQSVDAGISEE